MWDELNDLVEGLEPQIRAAVVRSIARLKRAAKRPALELAWANGDAESVVWLLMGDSATAWQPLREAVVAAVQASAVDTVTAYIKPHAAPLLRVLLGQGTDPRIASAVHSRLVSEIDATTRRALTRWVRDSISLGENPESGITSVVGYVDKTTGIRQGGVLGLTTQQGQAVRNFRRLLEEQRFAEAMERALRDKRFDPTLRAGEKLMQDQIDKMVAAYESRMLAYRARTIARSESARAHAAGQRQAWDTAISQGRVRPGALIKRWVGAGDERMRDHHREVHNFVIPYDRYFIIRHGSLKKPLVSHVWGPPHEPNCRCVLSIRPLLDPDQIFNESAAA